ncbi:SDR family oxidoreductase [Lysobacter soli]|uniref:SDR family NAD(P)-dependent oxidoreductase n=1 Tax=Lysobacter soli TaxID=453783 RepID=A0A3D8VF65_9GAMM|nr:SDR family oxidoreductase [Lysobacter soli]RDY67468.1 SDR family NAD(P)-dependent oxidoreductase [Lysobacter soli]
MARHKPIERQVIVITGASSGIGLATALTAAEKGATVVMLARSEQTLAEIAEEIRASGGHALALTVDVGDADAVAEAVDRIVAEFGRIDTWVNNAGVSIYGSLDEIGLEDARRLFDTNFWGVVHGSLAALPHLRRENGALINVGSEVSEAVVPLQGMYTASKHAVKGFTDALRVEVENVDRSGMSVVLIQPTAVNTPFPEHARNYMSREPKLPDPQIDPAQVAAAIIEAAQSGGRDIKVGSMARLNVMASRLMPRVADRLSARQVDKQQLDEAPIRPQGTLYEAGQAGRVHGSHR